MIGAPQPFIFAVLKLDGAGWEIGLAQMCRAAAGIGTAVTVIWGGSGKVLRGEDSALVCLRVRVSVCVSLHRASSRAFLLVRLFVGLRLGRVRWSISDAKGERCTSLKY